MGDRTMHEAALARKTASARAEGLGGEAPEDGRVKSRGGEDPKVARRHRAEAETHRRAASLHEQAAAIQAGHVRSHDVHETDT
jgi:hypothetical protein